VDAKLLTSLWEGTLADTHQAIAEAYVAVIKGGGSLREIDSILGQIEFLKENLPSDHAALAPLQAIVDGVKAKFGRR
jgi:hypothetical protein